MSLTSKLQHLFQQEINRASDPSTSPLLKINTVPDTAAGKILEYKQLMKGLDGKIGWMVAQNNLQDFHKYTKNILPKDSTHYFLFIKINYQRTRNQPTFASARIYDQKKNILTMYDSP